MKKNASVESILSGLTDDGIYALHQNNHLFQFAIQNDSIHIVDAGDESFQLFDYVQDDGRQILFCTASPQQQKTLHQELYEKALKGDFLSFTCPACTKEGVPIWVHVEASFLRWENGYPVYQGIVTDIADLVIKMRQLEKIVAFLQDKNRNLESFSHQITSCIVKIANNPLRTLLYGNESFFRMTGYTQEEFSAIHHNQLAGLLNANDFPSQELFQKKSVLFGYRCRIMAKNGSAIWTRMDASLTNEQYEGFPVFYVYLTDIGSQIQQEEETIRQQYFSSLITSSIAGGNLISSLDDSRTLIYFSDSLLKLLGYTKKEFEAITQGSLINMIWPDDRARIADEYDCQLDNNDVYELDYRIQKKDKTIIWVMEKGRRIKDQSGEFVHISILLDITDRKTQQFQLLRKTQVDSLTGLYNREYARQEIINYLHRRKTNHSSVLFVLDLDNFKHINDHFGHLEGDNTLIQTSNILAANFRSRDIIGRIGGDEFIVFMKDVPQFADAETKARQFCEAIEKCFCNKFENFQLSVSIGGAFVFGEEATYYDLFRTADMALYQAKFSGKNTWRIQNKIQQEDVPSQDSIFSFTPANQASPPRPDHPLAEILQQNFLLRQQQVDDERYRIITEHSNTLIFEWNIETERCYTSPQLAEFVFCRSWQKLFQQPKGCLEGIHSGDSDTILKFYTQIWNGAPFCETTVRLLKQDETYTWCRIALTIMRFETGQIKRVIGTVNDVDESMRTMRVLKYHAEHDLLTGYSNFEKYKYDVTELQEKKKNSPYSLWYCDIKNFKYINDFYGYDTGDKLLKYWAKVIADLHGPDEPFARISADHFTCLRHYKTQKDLETYFQTIVHYLENFEALSCQQFKVELVAGIYCIETTEDVMSVEEMLDRANIAQKSVKSESGSRYAFYTDEMRDRFIYERKLEAQMEKALQDGAFNVYLQAQVDIQKNNSIIGAEALVRWKESGQEVITPGRFIPLFEKNGFIMRLDHYIFEKVCQYVSQLQAQGKQLHRISVNVSRITMMRPNFAELYDEIKCRYSIPDGMLELECTESVFAENYQLFAKIIEDLRHRGFSCAMDDFGTGYSSLTLLKDLPIDVLKLDMMFFRQGDSPQRDTAILRNVISMAKDLNMRVIAEGVETYQQVDLLKSIGCDCVQGFVFSPPIPIEDFDFDAPVVCAAL